MDFYESVRNELTHLDAISQRRSLRRIDCVGKYAMWEGRKYLNLSGNDYLGVASDLELRNEFYHQFTTFSSGFAGLSAASSRLLTGNSSAYEVLEESLCRLYPGRAALVFNSGYHANIGILPALSSKGDLILSDKLNHASIIDGLRLCEADFRRYPHGDCERLAELLEENTGKYRQIFIITESVFSMDGDWADLRRIVELKKKYQALLIVDEAHSVGVFGADGAGLAAEWGIDGEIDVLVGTFGKAFGSAGAYGIMRPELREYLINKMRPVIFSTGLPPVVLSWSNFVLQKLPEMAEGRRNLLAMAARLREILRDKGCRTLGDSQIVPWIIGDNRETVEIAEKLRANGVLVFPIRPPTVPAGSARLRFSLNGALSMEDIELIGSLI